MRRVLVTGGSGFLGSNAVRALAAHPDVSLVVSGDVRPPAQVHVHLGVEHPLQGGFHHQPHQAVEVLDGPGLAGHLTGELLRPRT